MSKSLNRSDWEAKAKALSIRSQAFINGHYVDAASGKTFSCISPIAPLGERARC